VNANREKSNMNVGESKKLNSERALAGHFGLAYLMASILSFWRIYGIELVDTHENVWPNGQSRRSIFSPSANWSVLTSLHVFDKQPAICLAEKERSPCILLSDKWCVLSSVLLFGASNLMSSSC
jgi:hypothetical protein